MKNSKTYYKDSFESDIFNFKPFHKSQSISSRRHMQNTNTSLEKTSSDIFGTCTQPISNQSNQTAPFNPHHLKGKRTFSSTANAKSFIFTEPPKQEPTDPRREGRNKTNQSSIFKELTDAPYIHVNLKPKNNNNRNIRKLKENQLKNNSSYCETKIEPNERYFNEFYRNFSIGFEPLNENEEKQKSHLKNMSIVEDKGKKIKDYYAKYEEKINNSNRENEGRMSADKKRCAWTNKNSVDLRNMPSTASDCSNNILYQVDEIDKHDKHQSVLNRILQLQSNIFNLEDKKLNIENIKNNVSSSNHTPPKCKIDYDGEVKDENSAKKNKKTNGYTSACSIKKNKLPVRFDLGVDWRKDNTEIRYKKLNDKEIDKLSAFERKKNIIYNENYFDTTDKMNPLNYQKENDEENIKDKKITQTKNDNKKTNNGITKSNLNKLKHINDNEKDIKRIKKFIRYSSPVMRPDKEKKYLENVSSIGFDPNFYIRNVCYKLSDANNSQEKTSMKNNSVSKYTNELYKNQSSHDFNTSNSSYIKNNENEYKFLIKGNHNNSSMSYINDDNNYADIPAIKKMLYAEGIHAYDIKVDNFPSNKGEVSIKFKVRDNQINPIEYQNNFKDFQTNFYKEKGINIEPVNRISVNKKNKGWGINNEWTGMVSYVDEDMTKPKKKKVNKEYGVNGKKRLSKQFANINNGYKNNSSLEAIKSFFKK